MVPDSSDTDEGNVVLSARLLGEKKHQTLKNSQNQAGQGFGFGIKRNESRERNRDVTSVTVLISRTRRRSLQPPPSQEGSAAARGTDVINEMPDLTSIIRLQSWEGRGSFCSSKKNLQTGKLFPHNPAGLAVLPLSTLPLEQNSSFFISVYGSFCKMKPGRL